MKTGLLYCFIFLPVVSLAADEDVLSNILTELTRLGDKTKELEDDVVEKGRKINKLEAKLAEKDRELAELRKDLQMNVETDKRQLGTRAEFEVGFSASVAHRITNLNANQAIVFDKILTNMGHHYNNTTGIFYVPVAGTYIFYANILSEVNSYIETELLVNGNLLAEIFSGSGKYNGAGSNLVIAHLAQGDNVWVKVHGTQSSNMAVHCCWSTFSGYLLREGSNLGPGQVVG